MSLEGRESDMEISAPPTPPIITDAARTAMTQRLKELDELVIAVNDEDHKRLRDISKGAGGYERRRVIRHEGMLQKLTSAESGGGERSIRVWLFDDIMMYARPLPSTGKFQLLRWMPLRGCKVEKKKASKDSWGFSVTNKGKGVILLAKDEEERDTWVDKMEACLRDLILLPEGSFGDDEEPDLDSHAFDGQIAELELKAQKARQHHQQQEGTDDITGLPPSSTSVTEPDDGWSERVHALTRRLLEEESRRQDLEADVKELRGVVDTMKRKLKEERETNAALKEDVKRERRVADQAITKLKSAEVTHEAAIEAEVQKRVRVELQLRKEKAINDLSKNSRLTEMHELRRLEEDVEGMRRDKAELQNHLDNSIRENEALMRESRTLHAALGASKQMYAAEEVQAQDHMTKLGVMESRGYELLAKVAERDREIEAWKRTCRLLERDLDRAQVMLATVPNAGASFLTTCLQRGQRQRRGGGAGPAAGVLPGGGGMAARTAAHRDSFTMNDGDGEGLSAILLQRGAGKLLPSPGLMDSVRHYHSLSNNRSVDISSRHAAGGTRLMGVAKAMREAIARHPKGLEHAPKIR